MLKGENQTVTHHGGAPGRHPQANEHYQQQQQNIHSHDGVPSSSWSRGADSTDHLQFVSSQDSKAGVVGASTKPTHRRKKSQQPTLMTTKQKQQSNEGSNATTSGRQPESTNDQQIRFEFHPDEHSSQQMTYNNKPSWGGSQHHRNPTHHVGGGQIILTGGQLVGDQVQQLLSDSKRSTNSNLKERQTHHHQEQRVLSSDSYLEKSKVGAPIQDIRAFQPLSPKMQSFAALSQVRDKVHSLGGASDNDPHSKFMIGSTASASGPTLIISSDKKNKAKKLTSSGVAAPVTGQQPLYNRGERAQNTQNHHKRNQTKSHYPAANLFLQGNSSGKAGNETIVQFKHSTIPEDLSSRQPLHDSLSARPHESHKSKQLKMSSATTSTNEIIQQLMKNHMSSGLMNPSTSSTESGAKIGKEDAKAAYLRHAANVFVPQDISNSKRSSSSVLQPNASNATSVYQSQQFYQTPSADSPSKGKIQHTNPPKRVTFVHKNESESSSQIREETEEDHSYGDQMISYVRDDFSSGDKAEAEQIVEQLKHCREQSKQGTMNPTHQEEEYMKNNDYTDEDNEGSQECENAPTVVIETSIDENDCAAQYRGITDEDASHVYGDNDGALANAVGDGASQSKPNASCLVLDNIQAALRSIRMQEEEEQSHDKGLFGGLESGFADKKKKAVTIMTIEEEEALISQINEIRERIRRGETAAQQQNTHQVIRHDIENEYQSQFSGKRESLPPKRSQRGNDYEDKQEDESDIVLCQEQQETFNEYGGRQSLQPNYSTITKPPLYSLTFAHPDLDPSDPQFNIKSQENGSGFVHIKQKSFNSIDNNAPSQVNCLIVTDGPNIYEKKRQRFERIQRMRNNGEVPSGSVGPVIGAYGTLNIGDGDAVSSNYHASREGNTPIAGSSSCVSGNYASLVKNQQPQCFDSRKKQFQAQKMKKPSAQKAKSFSSKSVQKQGPTASIRRSGDGKSRQNSTADQFAHSITTQSQYHVYHSSTKSNSGITGLGGGGGFRIKGPASKGSSLSNKKDQAIHSHLTLDPDGCGNSSSYTGLYAPVTGEDAHTYRGSLHRGGYEDEEEMQIQLFSLKKIIPGTQSGTTTWQRTKVTMPHISATQAALKKKLITKSRKGASINAGSNSAKGSIVVPSTQYHGPSSMFHHKEKSVSHIKNNKSNLMINISEVPAHSGSLGQSLSLKRLKTPKLKLKDDINTPPFEKNSQPHQQKASQFQSVPVYKLQNNPAVSSSVKNQQHALNYQTASSYKSPFIYPQTSKASHPAVVRQPNVSNDLKIIDTKRGASSSHIKQKSLHIGPTYTQQQQIMKSQGCRSGSIGGQQKIVVEPAIAQKLMHTKRKTDHAFDSLKRKISESRIVGGQPHNIQPTKHVSTVSSVSTISNQFATNHASLSTLQPNDSPQAVKVFKKTPLLGGDAERKGHSTYQALENGAERVMHSHGNNTTSLMEFEKNYKKLSGLLDKIFTI